MNEMVERVAIAIFEACPYKDSQNFQDHDDRYKHNVRSYARAAIEAMREPTDAMSLGLPDGYKPGSHSATQIWRAMIDAALGK